MSHRHARRTAAKSLIRSAPVCLAARTRSRTAVSAADRRASRAATMRPRPGRRGRASRAGDRAARSARVSPTRSNVAITPARSTSASTSSRARLLVGASSGDGLPQGCTCASMSPGMTNARRTSSRPPAAARPAPAPTAVIRPSLIMTSAATSLRCSGSTTVPPTRHNESPAARAPGASAASHTTAASCTRRPRHARCIGLELRRGNVRGWGWRCAGADPTCILLVSRPSCALRVTYMIKP